jgi:hypothetical protein
MCQGFARELARAGPLVPLVEASALLGPGGHRSDVFRLDRHTCLSGDFISFEGGDSGAGAALPRREKER